MDITSTDLAGCFVFDLEAIEDERGFFARSFCPREFEDAGLSYEFRIQQTNIALNRKRGTLRGMHWQASPYPDPKIVRVVRGAIYDVVLDIRKGSDTYGRWISAELTADNRRAVIVPPNCAHGFLTLSDDTEVHYLMGEDFHPHLARGSTLPEGE